MENVKNNPWDLYLIIQGSFCTNPPHSTFITCCPAQQELLIKHMIFSGREDLLLPWGVVTRFAEHGADQVRKRLISPFLLFHGQWPLVIVIVMAVAFLEQNRSQHRTMVQNPDCSFVFLDYAKVQVSCQEQFCVKSEIFFQSNGEFTISCNRAHNLVSGCNYRTTKVDSRNNFL